MSKSTAAWDYIEAGLWPLAVPIESVREDPANARVHSGENLDAIRASLRRYKQRTPIVVNAETGIIEKGNATWAVMRAEGHTHVAALPVHDDPTTATGYAIADNRSAEKASWDLPRLIEQLRALETLEELPHVGFSLEELRALSADRPEREPFDLQAELQKIAAPRCAVGEVWALGPHRLACGDSTLLGTWADALEGRKADLVVTSPPYNVGIKYASYPDRVGSRDKYLTFIGKVVDACAAWLDHGRFVAWNIGVSPDTYAWRQVIAFEDCGFTYHRQIVWVKQGVPWPLYPLTRKKKRARFYTPNYRHERVFVMQANGTDGEPVEPTGLSEHACPVCEGEGRVQGLEGGANGHDIVVFLHKGTAAELGGPIAPPQRRWADDVWYIAQQMSAVGVPTLGEKAHGMHDPTKKPRKHAIKAHPATFPVELPRAVMTFLSAEGEIVVDPFMGAGATLMACEAMGRRAVGIELDPIYCELTMRRWEQATGQKAVQA